MARTAEMMDQVAPFTKSTRERLESMRLALKLVEGNGVPGDVVEVGVWRGGNIMLAMKMLPDRQCWLYDTFDGMTVPGEHDTKADGEKAIERYRTKQAGGMKWDAVSLYECKAGFYLVGLDPDKARWVVGPAEETLERPETERPSSIAVLRLDADWYAPTRAALRHLYPRLSPGGVLIVDDYGHWMGCKKAVDEYFGLDAPRSADVDYSCRLFYK